MPDLTRVARQPITQFYTTLLAPQECAIKQSIHIDDGGVEI